jgi:hypothetical protein
MEVEAAMATNHTQATRESLEQKQRRRTAQVEAPWPDQQARREMSETELAPDALGKHSKNPGGEDEW